VAFDVIHADERLVERISHRLRVRDANKQRAYETWANGDGDPVDVSCGHAGAFEGLRDDGHDLVEVFARSELRNDAAEAFVNRNLRRDHGRQDLASIAHQRSRRFVTGCFDTEYEH
jgi:hypothetical protein